MRLYLTIHTCFICLGLLCCAQGSEGSPRIVQDDITLFTNNAITSFRIGNYFSRYTVAPTVAVILQNIKTNISLQWVTNMLGRADEQSTYEGAAINAGIEYLLKHEGGNIYQYMRITIKEGRISDILFGSISSPSFLRRRLQDMTFINP